MDTIRILYMSSNGAGFQDFIQVRKGITFGELFAEKNPGANPDQYTIKVTRNGVKDFAVKGDLVQENDRVSVALAKQAGAAVAA